MDGRGRSERVYEKAAFAELIGDLLMVINA